MRKKVVIINKKRTNIFNYFDLEFSHCRPFLQMEDTKKIVNDNIISKLMNNLIENKSYILQRIEQLNFLDLNKKNSLKIYLNIDMREQIGNCTEYTQIKNILDHIFPNEIKNIFLKSYEIEYIVYEMENLLSFVKNEEELKYASVFNENRSSPKNEMKYGRSYLLFINQTQLENTSSNKPIIEKWDRVTPLNYNKHRKARKEVISKESDEKSPTQYHPDINIYKLEHQTIFHGKLVLESPNRIFAYAKFSHNIDNKDKCNFVRVQVDRGTSTTQRRKATKFHGFPIDENRYMKDCGYKDIEKFNANDFKDKTGFLPYKILK